MVTVSAAGVDIPVVGLGTYGLTGEAGAALISRALQTGYRHLDTASLYNNEQQVGEGLRHSGIARSEVFVTTKVWKDDLDFLPLRRSLEASLQRLGMDYVDLVLMHWPNPQVSLTESLASLAELKRRGLARAIGVSNFTVSLLEAAVAKTREPLATNQVEYHPFLSQKHVLAACRRLGVSLTAYSPLAQGRVHDDPTLSSIAAARGVTPAQVAIRWLVQQVGVIAIPKTASIERASTNLDVFGFELTEDEMTRITALARPDGRGGTPPWAPQWDPE